jgi:hypothetical protein
MLCKSEFDPFKERLPLKKVDIEPLLPREVVIGVGLDVMDIRRDSERLLDGNPFRFPDPVVFNLVGVVPMSVADAILSTSVPEDSRKVTIAVDEALELDETETREEFPKTWAVSNAYEKKCRTA